ncbi:hypothetical protein [Streptomyces sp. ZS0098]|uniref:hypothetical protein n=1 Tax=Streptomyces sp. ZS0098 TaxID=1904044 RepID=UPI0011C39B66|nr:hypothetical protein [Streptomyces sp. ZS0098]
MHETHMDNRSLLRGGRSAGGHASGGRAVGGAHRRARRRPGGATGAAGFGLAGPHERLEVLDGTLRAELGEGTFRLTAEVPLIEVTA